MYHYFPLRLIYLVQYLRNLSLPQGHEDVLLDYPKIFIIIFIYLFIFTYSI